MEQQEQVVQELKKENFDLKLRLYMQEKQGENNEGKVSEYEQQLGAILNKLEEQQSMFESSQRELAEARQKEKLLMKRQRNLESECKLRDEKIANLNMSLTQLSTSMTNIASPRHYTPARNTRSMYWNPDSEEDEEEDNMEAEDGVVATSSLQHSPLVSCVAPMRAHDRDTPLQYNDEMRLMNNNNNHRSGRNSFESTNSDPTSRGMTKNYYNTTINNPLSRGEGIGASGHDNIGVVKPNNSRTVVDVEIPEHGGNNTQQNTTPQDQNKKKKKKGIFGMLKLCSGKSNQQRMPTREDSMYHKRPTQVARVTMQQYNSLGQGSANSD